MIPTIITQLARGQSHVALGSLTPSRDFMFVDDTVSAFLAVGDAAGTAVVGEVFNAGTGIEITIRDLAHLIAEIMGVPFDITSDDYRRRPEASEVERLVCNAGKLRHRTGWRPRHTLETGLKLTVDWFADPTNLTRYSPERHV